MLYKLKVQGATTHLKTCQKVILFSFCISEDCVLSDWTNCSHPCGGTRSRSINVQPMFGGRECGNLNETCNLGKCKPGQLDKVAKWHF